MKNIKWNDKTLSEILHDYNTHIFNTTIQRDKDNGTKTECSTPTELTPRSISLPVPEDKMHVGYKKPKKNCPHCDAVNNKSNLNCG